MIESIFHINVNCTNFERSLEFYKTLGFEVTRDLNEVGNKTEGQAHPHLWHAGMCRIALRTRTLVKDYEELKGKGIEFWTEPIMFELKDGRQEGFVCCSDPDGTVIELIQV